MKMPSGVWQHIT